MDGVDRGASLAEQNGVWRAIGLDAVKIIAREGCSAQRTEDHISFDGASAPWGYIARSILPEHKSGIVRIRASINIRSGAIGFGVLNKDETDFLHSVFATGPGSHVLECSVDCAQAPGAIIFRNGPDGSAALAFTLDKIEYLHPESQPGTWLPFDFSSIHAT